MNPSIRQRAGWITTTLLQGNYIYTINNRLFPILRQSHWLNNPTGIKRHCKQTGQTNKKTKEKTQQLMDYLNTYPGAYIRYYASNMVLHVDSDAAYLVDTKAKSCIAAYYHLSNHPNITKHPKLNSAILVEYKTLRHVVSSSAEAEAAWISTTLARQSQSGISLMHSTIPNHPPHLKPKIQRPQASYRTTFIKSVRSHEICDITGCRTNKHNNNLLFSGNRALAMKQTTSPNIIQQSTTATSKLNMWATN